MMLYIHLPFCKQKCSYCAFCSGTFSPDIMRRYVDKLIHFTEHYVSGRQVRTIYIGGGTPSVLPIAQWQRLLEGIAAYTDISAVEEFTVELNPESTTAQLLQLLKNSGVNRLSFGVQSLVDGELSAIGRLHTARQALEALRLASQWGFDNISADLMYGLPNQTIDSFDNSVRGLLKENITHLSCYNLQLEEGTPLYSNRESLTFPDEDEQMEMYDRLISLTKTAGFEHYEISNFCKKGMKAKHNSGYWTREDYLGLGVAAHSKLGDKRYSFSGDIQAFIEKEDFSFDDVTELTAQDIRQEQIMLGLRTNDGVPCSLVDGEKVSRFVDMGLGQLVGERFVLSEKGFMLSNTIISELI